MSKKTSFKYLAVIIWSISIIIMASLVVSVSIKDTKYSASNPLPGNYLEFNSNKIYGLTVLTSPSVFDTFKANYLPSTSINAIPSIIKPGAYPTGFSDHIGHISAVNAFGVASQIMGRPARPALGVVKPYEGDLQLGDIILSVNKNKVHFVQDIKNVPSNKIVTVKISRKSEILTIKTYGRSVRKTQYKPLTYSKIPNYSFGSLKVSGASASLALTLDYVNEMLGGSFVRFPIAVTGEVRFDGSVAHVGSIEEKTIVANKTGALVMIVPLGQESLAKDFNGTVVPVESVNQALKWLCLFSENNKSCEKFNYN